MMPRLAVAPASWVHSPRFDTSLLFGTVLLGLSFGLSSAAWPWLFPILLTLDLWLLGYHHVVSTFTRLSFDRESFRTYRFHILVLPFLVVAFSAVLYFQVGNWTLGTLYFYWQAWHYARQSFGIHRMLERSADPKSSPSRLTEAFLYALPLVGVLARSHEQPTRFLDMAMRLLPVPVEAVWAAGVATLGLGAWWLISQFRSASARRAPLATAYVGTHVLMFGVGYLLLPMEVGWLGINVWHNMQYILIVWLTNHKRFGGKVHQEHAFLSQLSLPGNVVRYLVICLGLSSLVYVFLIHGFGWTTVPVTFLLIQSINFHHYIVDAIIWRSRRRVVVPSPAGAA